MTEEEQKSLAVSVVIPTLNEEDELPQCIEKLKNQIQEGDEIIVVDGGSSDATVHSVQKYDCRVILATNEDKTPSTIGAARNVGALKAENDIIATTDADALPPDGWVETIRLHFQRDDDLTVLWGNIRDRNGVPIRNITGKFWTIFGGASGNNTAFRKSAFDELQSGYPDSMFAEDFSIIAKLATKGKIKRDEDLVMTMDMDRRRYQTDPLLITSAVGMMAGNMIGGQEGNLIKGASMGLAGTELTFEGISQRMGQDENTKVHHDSIGYGIATLGSMIGGGAGGLTSGVGLGVITHHWATEGISALPSPLSVATDEVIGSV